MSRENHPSSSPTLDWRQGALLTLTIVDLSNSGDGVGRCQERVVFVPNAVPGDRLSVRLLHVKPQYAHGRIEKILKPSPHRIRPACIVADKCGGCQWQPVEYERQLEAKQAQVIQSLERIGGLNNPPVDTVLASPPLGYRNKVSYPLGTSATGQVQAGYYQKSSHRLVNLNQCPIQDPRLNPLLAEVKQDIQQRGWSIYDETQHQGLLRHLSLRIGQRTGEMLLTLVATTLKLPDLNEQAELWLDRYPDLVGVFLNSNPDRTNAIFGSETRCIAGQPYLREILAGLQFQIRPTTFFQVNTAQAEALLQTIQQELRFQGHELVIDAYCGIGTLTLPIAQQVRQVIGIEVQSEAIEQAEQNARINHIDNVTFHVGKTEDQLPQLLQDGDRPDVVLLDPPRKGCDASVLKTLLTALPDRIVYVSCDPATLARDLKVLCQEDYCLTRVQPADFFPQTSHVECAAFLSQVIHN